MIFTSDKLIKDTDIEIPAAKLQGFFSPQLLICLALAILTLTAYWPVRDCGFVNYDDTDYVVENKMVHRGLTAETVRWAFQTTEMSNWHPLTWLSYLLDWQLFGKSAGGFHLTNLFFHTVNAVLLFLLMHQMTGARWQSFLVAAIFALHPLHVESVAWISERKDVLSGLFFFLTLLAYVACVRRKAGKQVTARGFYLLALFFFALGLLSKPMLVTLPFILLLLDLWPLHRVFPESNKMFGKQIFILFVEKVPFFILTVLASILTFVAQAKGGSVSSLEAVPLGLRLVNAFVACALYLKKMFWPTDLAVFYPYHTPKILNAALAVIFVLGVSMFALTALRRKPRIAAGWFWFLGMLIPVVGIVQVGGQALADRYTYLPMIGISILVVWGISEFSHNWPFRKNILTALSAATLAACFILTRTQLPAWKNSETLWRHAIAVTSKNDLAYYNLGSFLTGQGRNEEAAPLFQKAVEIYPRYAEAHNALGQYFAQKKNFDDALTHYELAIKYKPNLPIAHKNLGDLFNMMGKLDDAAAEYSKTLEFQPDLFDVHYNLAVILFSQEKTDAAIAQYSQALRLKPNMWQAQVSLGILQTQKGNFGAAKNHFLTALQINPDYAEGHFLLANLLAENGDLEAAKEHYRAALKLKPDYTQASEKLKALSNKDN